MAVSPISPVPLAAQPFVREDALAATTRKPKVLQVINSLLTGGAERVLVTNCLALRDLGCEVDACTLYHEGPFAAPLREAGFTIHNLALDPGIAKYQLRRKYDPRGILRLARVIKAGGYDVVHAHLFPAGMFAALALMALGRIPLVYSEHSVSNRRRKKLFWWLDRLVYSRYNAVVAVSPAVATSLKDWLPFVTSRLTVVPNAVHLREAAGLGEEQRAALRESLKIAKGEKLVLFAGRLERQKGPDVLLRALPKLLEQCPDVRVLLAGDGRMRSKCESLIQRLHLGGRATLLGDRRDIPLLMDLADLVVLPSRCEGLPMTLLEAMACGRAVVATRVAAMPELIEESRSGWIVDPENPEALARGLVEALSQERERTLRGQNGMALVREQYSAERRAATLLKIYRELM
jgi:glycosyltransferase involved in cell wall biosynthesis